jgi:VIT1/CCC1 family predicted Fe2+/Mn2+ transporter
MLVARELTEKDALAAHMRDELGLSEVHVANPMQAALASGFTFCVAAAIPVACRTAGPGGLHHPHGAGCVGHHLGCVLGALGAKAGAAPLIPATMRVVLWGIFAMAITAGVGKLFGIAA